MSIAFFIAVIFLRGGFLMENVEKLSNSKPSSYNPMTDRSVVPLLISMAVPPYIIK